MRTTTPVQEGLFVGDGEQPYLLGGRCTTCMSVSFPRQRSCVHCAADTVAEHRLPRLGRLWTWTVQRFRPKEPYAGPEAFEPYGVGYVDLGEIIVETRLTTADPDLLEIGRTMELVVVPFTTTPDGVTTVTYAFAPVEGAST